MKKELTDKIKGGILGLAIGDALGVPVEFIDRNTLKKNPITNMKGYGTHNVPKGTWSDDTSLTIAAMDSIIERGEVNYDDIMSKFVLWTDLSKYTATGHFFDIGNATSKAIYNYKCGINPIDCGVKGTNENGNGSLMRILPFSLYSFYNNLSEDEEVRFINDSSSITHGHEISCLGCKIYTDYIKSLLCGNDKEYALEQLKNNNYLKYYSQDSLDYYERIIKRTIKNCSEEEISSSGFVVSTLEAAIWCTMNSDNYESSVIKAVNLGNDTDTVGAVTGSINGIIYGKDNIPKKWMDELKQIDYLNDLSGKFISTISRKKGVKIR